MMNLEEMAHYEFEIVIYRGVFNRNGSIIVECSNLGPFSISLFKLSQLNAKSWSPPSNLLQKGFSKYSVQAHDLSEILTWDSS